MLRELGVYFQYILPQHLISRCVGHFANSKNSLIKNTFIKWFANKYQVDLSEALIQNPTAYQTFNDFFTRQLKPELRPIALQSQQIAAPVDGVISELGDIYQSQLLQAKNMYYDLQALFGSDEYANIFQHGKFATFYLAPSDYHRVHMPLAGQLLQTTYIPGRLFSVNHLTSTIIPQLYTRNERLVTLWQTEAGIMAVIFVGAMIVGNIQTVWMTRPARANQLVIERPATPIHLNKGAEIGNFHLGSTVILLFQPQKVDWKSHLGAGSTTRYGEEIGQITSFRPA